MKKISSNTVLPEGTKVRIVGNGAELGTVKSGEMVPETTGKGWLCSHVITITHELKRISGIKTGWVPVAPKDRQVNYSFIYID